MKTMLEAHASVFAELEAISPKCKIFTIASGASLDASYLGLYGKRMTFDDFDSKGTAQAVKVMFAAKWDSAFDLFTAANGLMQDMGNMSTTVTNKEYGYTDKVSNNDNVPAFDVETPQLEKQTERELSHNDTINKETVTSDSRDISRFGAGFNYLQKNLINDIVFRDLNALATLSIHTL